MVAAGRCMHGRHHREQSLDSSQMTEEAGGNAGLFFLSRCVLCRVREAGISRRPGPPDILARPLPPFRVGPPFA